MFWPKVRKWPRDEKELQFPPHHILLFGVLLLISHTINQKSKKMVISHRVEI